MFATRNHGIVAKVAQRLAEAGACNALRLDMPGNGRSGGEFTYAGYADEARCVLRAARWLRRERGLLPALVVGHSKGGTVALLAAAAASSTSTYAYASGSTASATCSVNSSCTPGVLAADANGGSCVTTTTCCSSHLSSASSCCSADGTVPNPPRSRDADSKLDSAVLMLCEEDEEALEDRFSLVVNLCGRVIYGPHLKEKRFTEEQLREIEERGMVMHKQYGKVWKITRQALEERKTMDMSHLLTSITAQVFTIFGADDDVLSLDEAKFVADRVPKHQLKLIPGANHNFLGKEVEVAEAIIEWFTEHNNNS
ncbi:hypothetical protein Pelo_14509 [Pelomyxa schiedti]|nr:hypothetical protein Pelo_14509 [Pelomyxa schiedti]